jgi:hypothetical protein
MARAPTRCSPDRQPWQQSLPAQQADLTRAARTRFSIRETMCRDHQCSATLSEHRSIHQQPMVLEHHADR